MIASNPPAEARTIGSTEERTSFSVGDLISLVIPVMIVVEVNFTGRLFLSEILLFAIMPALLWARGRILLEPLPRTLLFLGLLWLLSQIGTDVVRGSAFADYSRGWSKIAFVLINFSALYLLLYGRWSRIVMFAVGIAVGQILDFFISPSELAVFYVWKFGVGSALTLAIVLLAQTRLAARWDIILLFLAASLNLYLGFRSLGLICFMVTIVMFAHRFWWKKGTSANGRKSLSVGFIAVVFTISGIGVGAVYGQAANQGLLGESAKSLYERQARGSLGVLLGGRKEILASSQAIIDSPIVGHGSWAQNPVYFELMVDRAYQLGYDIAGYKQSNLIPSHSYVFGAWVESGVLGAVFWLWILILIGRVLVATFQNRSRYAPLIVFFSILLAWNVLFSPLGGEGRLYAAYQLVLLIFALEYLRSRGQANASPSPALP